jgi:hypothetical protein
MERGIESAVTLTSHRMSSHRLRARFTTLAAQWQQETGHFSSVAQKYAHPAYQEMLSMGEIALPWILQELQAHPYHWFAALRQLSGENPAATGDSAEAARQAWLEWGVAQGYLKR